MKFVIKPSIHQWYFNVVARNGRILATSERYHNRSDAVAAAQSIIDQAGGGTITYA